MSLRLTFSVRGVVSWEHDATAHDIPFEAARTKSISDPAAVEDLPIVCQTENKLLISFLSLYHKKPRLTSHAVAGPHRDFQSFVVGVITS